MVSRDQAGRLGFDSLGYVGTLQLAYAILSWLDVQVGAGGGGFPTTGATGGLLCPQLGAAAQLVSSDLRPYVQLNGGAGFTGDVLRPLVSVALGVELSLTDALMLGPALGYTHLFQKSGKTQSSDARFFWFGLSASWRVGSPVPMKQTALNITRYLDVERAVSDAPPAAPETNAAPSPELMVLLEDAVRPVKTELLAPILFRYDSDELEPTGVAMLHEVAKHLAEHPNLTRLEIAGYADARGARQYNLELSERRAQRVLEWLALHGVERERMQLAPRGAEQIVESGSDEQAHAQNRRVIFRVLEQSSP